MRVLITGGAGFAGHHLVEHLLAETDWQLVILDGLTYAGRVDRLTGVAGFDPARVDLVWWDLRAPIHASVDDAIGEVDAVLHLAAASHVDRSIADPVPFVQNNVDGTLNLLEWARTRDLSHFVQVSTDEVYGPAEPGQAHAEWSPIVPSNPYAASKAAQEAIAVSYWRTFGVPVVITNTMNMFGERQHPEKFAPMAVRSLLEGQPVTLHARLVGELWEPSSRCWLHARNHADALRWIMADTSPPRFGETSRPDRWHVAGEELDVLQVAHSLADALDRRLDYEFVDYHSSRPGHDHRYALNASKIAGAGWKPPVALAESLGRTARWYAEHSEWLR